MTVLRRHYTTVTRNLLLALHDLEQDHPVTKAILDELLDAMLAVAATL